MSSLVSTIDFLLDFIFHSLLSPSSSVLFPPIAPLCLILHRVSPKVQPPPSPHPRSPMTGERWLRTRVVLWWKKIRWRLFGLCFLTRDSERCAARQLVTFCIPTSAPLSSFLCYFLFCDVCACAMLFPEVIQYSRPSLRPWHLTTLWDTSGSIANTFSNFSPPLTMILALYWSQLVQLFVFRDDFSNVNLLIRLCLSFFYCYCAAIL